MSFFLLAYLLVVSLFVFFLYLSAILSPLLFVLFFFFAVLSLLSFKFPHKLRKISATRSTPLPQVVKRS